MVNKKMNLILDRHPNNEIPGEGDLFKGSLQRAAMCIIDSLIDKDVNRPLALRGHVTLFL